jgi:hypothetical protein
MEVPWHQIQTHFDWLGHVVEGFGIAAVVAVPFNDRTQEDCDYFRSRIRSRALPRSREM